MPVAKQANGHRDAHRQRLHRRSTRTMRGLLLAIGSAPFVLTLVLSRLSQASPWRQLDLLFVVVCHQKPERTLLFANTLMPVCSRCAGIFAGLFSGALLAWPLLSKRRGRLALATAAAFMLLDVVMQDAKLHPVWHSTRLATGWLLGHLAVVVLLAARQRQLLAFPSTPLLRNQATTKTP